MLHQIDTDNKFKESPSLQTKNIGCHLQNRNIGVNTCMESGDISKFLNPLQF